MSEEAREIAEQFCFGIEERTKPLADAIETALTRARRDALMEAATLADAIQVQQENDCGVSDTGGAARVAAAIRAKLGE